MEYQKLPPTYLAWTCFTLLIHKYFSIGASLDGLTLVPKVINKSATVMFGSDVFFFGKLALSSDVNEAEAKTSWFIDTDIIKQSYGRVSILDDGYTLCIKDFLESDEATYSFHYRVNTSYIITRFKVTGIDYHSLDSKSIAGSVIGLLLIFMVVFVIVFYCCRGGNTPARPSTFTRHDLVMHQKASETKKKSLHSLETRSTQLKSRCFHFLNSALNERKESYSNLCSESLDRNETQGKRNDDKSQANNNERKTLEKSLIEEVQRITSSADHPCNAHKLTTDV